MALAVLGAVVVLGLESIGLGAAARGRAGVQSELRVLAERKLGQVAVMTGADIRARLGITEGRFATPFDDAVWKLEIREAEAGTGLFAVVLEVRRGDGAIRVGTYVNRFGELWAQRRRAAP